MQKQISAYNETLLGDSNHSLDLLSINQQVLINKVKDMKTKITKHKDETAAKLQNTGNKTPEALTSPFKGIKPIEIVKEKPKIPSIKESVKALKNIKQQNLTVHVPQFPKSSTT